LQIRIVRGNPNPEVNDVPRPYRGTITQKALIPESSNRLSDKRRLRIIIQSILPPSSAERFAAEKRFRVPDESFRMCRLTLFTMCFLAALSGTLLRQAEAASDFVRFVAGFEDRQDIEQIDGAIGDDSGTTILRASSPHALRVMQPSNSLDVPVPPMPQIVSPAGGGNRGKTKGVATLFVGTVRKHAWLERFLF
jgi:hypothetical protein